jgi:hypothetical protein
VVQDEDNVLRRRSLVEAEFRLLDAAGSEDNKIAVAALESLARRLNRAGLVQDADAVRERIRREFPAETGDGTIEKREERKDRPKREPQRTSWPAVDPVEEPMEKGPIDKIAIYSLVPIHAQAGSLAERLDVYVDRSGNEVVFRGELIHDGLKLPPTTSPFRGPVGYMLREAWGVGRIVVVLVGGDLFAISPMHEKGESNPRLLWPNPIDIQGSPGDTRIVLGKSGVNEGRLLVLDQLNRPVGRVGPVRAGYLCFQRGSKLVAADTETGRTLWERLNLANDVTVVGDDHYVFLWHENQLLERLSTVDGHQIDQRKLDASPTTMFHQLDSLVWTLSHGEQLQLTSHDLRTGQTLWMRRDDQDSQVAVLDAETLAVATPNGQLHLLAARTGVAICQPLAIDTGTLIGLTAWQDSDRWYVALMRPPANANAWKVLKPSDNYRRQLVSGVLLAIDRQQPQIVWKKELRDEPFSLDQPRTAPVLVQTFRIPSAEHDGLKEGVVRVIDKRTGKTLCQRRGAQIIPSFLLTPQPEIGILDLVLPSETVRLRYSSGSGIP